VKFNAAKSKCIVCVPCLGSWSAKDNLNVSLKVGGNDIENVTSWPHLHRVILTTLMTLKILQTALIN